MSWPERIALGVAAYAVGKLLYWAITGRVA